MRPRPTFLAACAAMLLLTGCLGSERIVYTPASVSTVLQVPPGTEGRQIMVVGRVVAIEPRLADELKLGADFGGGAGSLLSGAETERLMQAVERSSKSKLLASPQAILVNGQPANVAVGKDQPYISGYSFTAARQTYEPVVRNAWTGVELNVLAIVSPPSPLLTLSLELQFSQLRELTAMPAADVPAELNLDAQFPEITAQSFHTTVAIPPGATLALMQPTDIRHVPMDLLVLITPRAVQ